MTNTNHPGRSHEFLSRLHDGDLSPAERAHFETHRAHCKECRSAAADFERALSLFRSSRSSPPPADLANRVLRKVQSAGASRRTPFGDLFSVDLRWAGAFAVALLVLLVAAPVVLQQHAKPAAPSEAPIAVALRSRENLPKGDSAGAAGRADAANKQLRQFQEPERNAPVSQVELQKKSADSSFAFANEPKTAADDKVTGKVAATELGAAQPAPEAKLEAAQAPAPAAPASTMATARRVAAPPAKPQAPVAQAAPPREASGGEGTRDQVTLSAGSPVLDRPARIVVQPLDALGAPPEIQARPLDPALNDLRGRSFTVLVDEQGRVLEAREASSKNSLGIQSTQRDEERAKEKDAALSIPPSEALKGLRFKPSERKRRVLLRID